MAQVSVQLLCSRQRTGNGSPLRRLQADDGHSRVLLFQVPADSHDGARRAHAAHKVRNKPVRLPPQLRACE